MCASASSTAAAVAATLRTLRGRKGSVALAVGDRSGNLPSPRLTSPPPAPFCANNAHVQTTRGVVSAIFGVVVAWCHRRAVGWGPSLPARPLLPPCGALGPPPPICSSLPWRAKPLPAAPLGQGACPPPSTRDAARWAGVACRHWCVAGRGTIEVGASILVWVLVLGDSLGFSVIFGAGDGCLSQMLLAVSCVIRAGFIRTALDPAIPSSKMCRIFACGILMAKASQPSILCN